MLTATNTATNRATATGSAETAEETISYSLGPLGPNADGLGKLLVAESGRGICAIVLGDDEASLLAELQRFFPQANLRHEARGALFRCVEAFAQMPAQAVELSLDIRGTEFQQRVWRVLRNIPAGASVSYGEVAEQLGMPKAVRAVAGACAANRLAMVIPCHRVLRKNGDLSGYRWGVERKRWLLQREKAQFVQP